MHLSHLQDTLEELVTDFLHLALHTCSLASILLFLRGESAGILWPKMRGKIIKGQPQKQSYAQNQLTSNDCLHCHCGCEPPPASAGCCCRECLSTVQGQCLSANLSKRSLFMQGDLQSQSKQPFWILLEGQLHSRTDVQRYEPHPLRQHYWRVDESGTHQHDKPRGDLPFSTANHSLPTVMLACWRRERMFLSVLLYF